MPSVEFLQEYRFVLKHKAGLENKVANALSQKVYILQTMSVQVTRFDGLKEYYESCPDFGSILPSLQGDQLIRSIEYVFHDGCSLGVHVYAFLALQ